MSASRPDMKERWSVARKQWERDLATIFRSHVDVRGKNDCWLWLGRTSGGYGTFYCRSRRRPMGAHVIAYEIAHGTRIQSDRKQTVVRHTCDTPLCCNPEHLVIGSQLNNVADCVSKERRHTAQGESCRHAKMSATLVVKIRQMRRDGATLPQLAKIFSVSANAVHCICLRKTWKHVP